MVIVHKRYTLAFMNEMNDMPPVPCLNCNKIVPQISGKREKKFCNNTCRSSHWQKERTKERNALKAAETGNIPAKKQVPETLKPVEVLAPSANGQVPKGYNFGDDKFLDISKYTAFRTQDKPLNRGEAATWLKAKAEADAKIKAAWKDQRAKE